jgi:hypothetical protein
MITVAHFDFYSYAVENRLQGRNGLDGKLYFDTIDENEHPLVCQEMNKHGCYAWKGTPWWMFWNRCFEWRCRRCRPWWMFWGRKDSDNCFGIRYHPAQEAMMPDEKGIRSFKETSYGYVLIDMLGREGFYGRRDPELHPEHSRHGVYLIQLHLAVQMHLGFGMIWISRAIRRTTSKQVRSSKILL